MSVVPPPPPSVPSELPLWAPYYGASLGTAFVRFWKKYATFSGRASRSEYWWVALIFAVVGIILEIVAVSTTVGTVAVSDAGVPSFGAAYYAVITISWVVSLATLVPTLAVVWRRLHDTNRSGGYYFIGLIPIVGGIILIVFLASAPDPAGARFDRPTS